MSNLNKYISLKCIARNRWLFLFLFILQGFAGFSGTKGAYKGNVISSLDNGFTYFEENLGQFKGGAYGQAQDKPLYFSKEKNTIVSFYKNRIVFQFSAHVAGNANEYNGQPTSNESRNINLLTLDLENTSKQVQIEGSGPVAFYKNYYLENIIINKLHPYRVLTYHGIYSGIDMVFSSSESGIKYSFLVQPGADASLIKMRWHGAIPALNTANGELHYQFPLGAIVEGAPLSFTGNGVSVESHYQVKDNTVSFNLGKYDRRQMLTIDPVLKWSTYYGGGMGNPTTVTTDINGNVIVAGYTSSSKNISTSFAYQSSIGGTAGVDYDAFVANFNSNGVLVWATYFGGAQNDIAKKIITDNSGNVWFCGYSQSQSAISTTLSYQPNRAKGKSGALNYDAFLVKLNPNGYRLIGTYYGGNGDDMAQGLAFDNAGNVYMSGITNSDSAIATTSGFQVVFSPSGSNAFLAKFSSAGSLSWATYYGTSDNEVKVTCDASGAAYITGTGGATPSSGAFQTKNGGAFLARFSSSGARLWGTYFGGGTKDIPYDITSDYKGSIIFAGATGSKSDIASPGVCFNTYNGEDVSPGDGFLAKFDSSGARLWSQYFGGVQNDAFLSVIVDSVGNIYGTGFTRSKSNIATSEVFQTAYAGSSTSKYGDAFISKFAPNGSLQWSTYYGGSEDDAGLAIAIDKKANLYIAGLTSSSSAIAIGGVGRTAYSGSGDGFLAKFYTPFCNFTPTISCIDKVCPGSTFAYSAAYHSNDKYYWGTNGGVIVSGQYLDTVMIKWDTSGIGTIKVIETGQFGCKDSVSLFVKKFQLPKAIISGHNKVCAGSEEKYTAYLDTTYKYHWSVSGGIIQNQPSDGSSINVKWGNNDIGLIKLIVYSANGCVDSLVDSIKIAPKPRIKVYPSGKICKGSVISLADNPVISYTYKWYSSPTGFSSQVPNPQVLVNTDIKYYVEATDTSSGCTNNDSVIIIVKPKPYPKALGSSTVCQGNMVYYYTKPTIGNSYSWKLNNGRFISRANTSQCQIAWDSSGTGSITVYETNPSGCTDSSTVKVKINPIPKAIINQDKSICYGAYANLGTTALKGHNYRWHSSPSGFSSSLAAISVKPANSTTYYLIEKDSVTGCAITDSMHIGIYSRPANLKIKGPGIVCGSTPIIFETIYDSGFQSKWKLDNGKILNGQGSSSVKTSWDSTKQGTVILYKIDNAGCKDSTSRDINILPAPPAFAGISQSICQGQSVELGDTGVSGLSYVWTSSTQSGTIISTSSNPIVYPSTDSKYQLKVTNNITGCFKNDSVQINVLSLPNVSITGNATYCVGESGSFLVKKVQGNTYKWKVEGGTVISGFGTEKIGVHWDKAIEEAYVRSIVVNANGCLDSMSLPIRVNVLPDTAIIGKVEVCQKGIYSYKAGQDKGFYTWKINGGYILSGQNTSSVIVQWTDDSMGTIYLQVMNLAGCAAYSTMNVKIEKIPVPVIKGQISICQNFSTNYIVEDIKGHTYNWIVNGGNIVLDKDTHAIDVHWDKPGQGSITIEQSSISGCKASSFLNVKVNAAPVPDFSADAVCEGQIMAFRNHTTKGFLYNWEFGDGMNTNDENAFHTYAHAGTYVVHLNAFSIDGCSQSFQKNVKVVKTPTAMFEVKKVCAGNVSYFQNKSKNGNGYLWDFGDGKTSTDSAPIHKYNKPGVYNVNLTAYASSGCNNGINLDAVVNPQPDASILISRDKNIYQVIARDSLQTYFHWDFGDGTQSDRFSVKHIYQSEGLYKIHLDITNGFNCSAYADTMMEFKYLLCNPIVYPNPFKETLNISYCLANHAHLKMVLIDQIGRPIKVFDMEQDAGTYNSIINTTDLSLHSGAYVMQLWINDNLYSEKLIHFR